jgi:hypothetical protein
MVSAYVIILYILSLKCKCPSAMQTTIFQAWMTIHCEVYLPNLYSVKLVKAIARYLESISIKLNTLHVKAIMKVELQKSLPDYDFLPQ